ncbi:MAG: hypothetical protein ACRCX2_27725 [Paraclostridium sp.]
MADLKIGSKKYPLQSTQKPGVRNIRCTNSAGVSYYIPMTTIRQPTPCIQVIDSAGTVWYSQEPTKTVINNDVKYSWTGRGVPRSGNSSNNNFGRAQRGSGDNAVNIVSYSGIGGAFKLSFNQNYNFWNDSTYPPCSDYGCSSWDHCTGRDCSGEGGGGCGGGEYRTIGRNIVPYGWVVKTPGFNIKSGDPAAPTNITESTVVNQTGKYNYSGNIHNLSIGVWYNIVNDRVGWAYEGGGDGGNGDLPIGIDDGFACYSIIDICRTKTNELVVRFDHSGFQNPGSGGVYTSYSKGWTRTSIGMYYESDGSTINYSLTDNNRHVFSEGWDSGW